MISDYIRLFLSLIFEWLYILHLMLCAWGRKSNI